MLPNIISLLLAVHTNFLEKVFESAKGVRGASRIVEMVRIVLREDPIPESKMFSVGEELLEQILVMILNLQYPQQVQKLTTEADNPLLSLKTPEEVVSYLDAVIRSGTSVFSSTEKSGTVFLLGNTGVGKTSLANTFAKYLSSPNETPTPVLTQDNPELLCTRVMQLYDGLSINKMHQQRTL